MAQTKIVTVDALKHYDETLSAKTDTIASSVESVQNQVNGLQQQKVEFYYYQSTSNTSCTGGSWTTVKPSESAGKFIWQKTKVTYVDGTATESSPVCMTGNIGDTGATGSSGKGIASTAITYAASSSGTSAPNSGWSASVPSVSNGQYLWTRTVTTFTDNTNTTSYSVGYKGTNGGTFTPAVAANGDLSWTNDKNLANPSTVNIKGPQGNVGATPAISIGTVSTLDAGSNATVTKSGTTAAPVFNFGIPKGVAGKGIKSSTVQYQVASSGTTIPTGTWNASPVATTAGQCLWTKVTITYTDDTTSVFYSVSVHGATGAKGATGETGATFTPSVASDGTLSWTNDKGKTNPSSVNIKGPTGATGNGIKSSTVQYQVSASGTTTPTGTWNTSVPATTAGQYLWTKVVLTFTNNSTSTFYAVAAHGATGAKGDKGATGDSGATFTPSVSSDGVLSWTNNKGLSNPASVNIKGPQGVQGVQGVAAGFGTPTATVDANVGTPSVTVTSSGANTAKVFNFAFKNLKGQKGDTGPTGATGSPANVVNLTNQNLNDYNYSKAGWYYAGGSNTVTNKPSGVDAFFLEVVRSADGWTTQIMYPSNNLTNTIWMRVYNGSAWQAWVEKGKNGTNGTNGAAGTAAGFGTPTASVDANVGTPSVTVTSSGANTAKVFNFAFKNLKGATGATGPTGKGISSIANTYQAGSSGTTAPTGTWSTSVPSTSAGQYLWTKTVITMSDNSSSTFYTVSRNGTNGTNGTNGAAAGFGTPTATVDANVGTPSVTVTASGANTSKVFNFAFKNLKGATGATGEAAGFGTPTATVDANTGTPSVTVTSSGANTAKVFNFAFKNLKGAKGDKGDKGTTGDKGADGVYKGITKHTMTTSNTSVTLNPNEVYYFPTMSSLTITLGTATNMFDEYHFFFTSGSTATTLTLPSTVKLPDGFAIEANKTYEISIANNLLLYQGWE